MTLYVQSLIDFWADDPHIGRLLEFWANEVHGPGLCGCGCGEVTAPKRFLKGHSSRRWAIERVAAQIEVTDSCWIWRGLRANSGYGQLSAWKHSIQAHRFVYILHNGPIPRGLVLDHLCRVRECVNPDHLEPVTNAENILRGEGGGAISARRDACAKGHPYSAENTTVRLRPGRGPERVCNICRREVSRQATARYRAKKRKGATA